jgi:small-conductance mechanosensitive channel
MLGLYLAMEVSQLPEKTVALIGRTLLVLGIASVTLTIASIVTGFIRTYSRRIESALPVTSLTQNLTRVVIFAIGIMIVLSSLGISITPLLATLGVGSLAVALGLQDTLANLFAGFYVILSRQVRVGDYIKLDSGEEGYVTDINWRMTKIKMLPNNTALVPNEKLTKSLIVNFYLPDRELEVLVQVGVHYDSDLEKVERVTVEVGKEIMREVPGGVAAFEPFIRFHTFNAHSVDFSVILRAREYVDQYMIKHEFIKRLHKRYAKEGIVIPYPIRAINYSQEKEGRPSSR